MDAPTPAVLTNPINCYAQGLIDKAQPHPKAKKIFVFCDGTGNEFNSSRDGDGNSNVVKLYTCLRVADNQVAYYHPGVGTLGDPAIRWRVARFWSKVKGLAFGAGFQANVLDAYRYLMEIYNDGDEIYIFGFSRGAYTARALGGILHSCGLLCRGNEGHLIYAWNIFHGKAKSKRKIMKILPEDRKDEDKNPHTVQRNRSFAETYSRDVTIRFMGLWDTVSSVGWIYSPVRLLDMAQNPIIQVGRHAVSIDERRAYYRDNLWGDPVPIHDPEWSEELRARGISQDLAQVWFPGAHSDVGGSYPQDEAAPANVTLRWMIDELKMQGAELCEERVAMVLGTPSGVYSADHIYTPPPEPDHCLHDQLKNVWWILQGFPQQYYDKEDAVVQWRVPYGTPRSIPSKSIIHWSAVDRLKATTAGEEPYLPLNLTLAQVRPVNLPVTSTTANLSGCFVYTAIPSKESKTNQTVERILKLAIGWVSFVLFWLLIGVIAWYFIGLIVSVAIGFFFLLSRTPGIDRILRLIGRWL